MIGCEDRLRNDLYCVGWGIKLYSNQNQRYTLQVFFDSDLTHRPPCCVGISPCHNKDPMLLAPMPLSLLCWLVATGCITRSNCEFSTEIYRYLNNKPNFAFTFWETVQLQLRILFWFLKVRWLHLQVWWNNVKSLMSDLFRIQGTKTIIIDSFLTELFNK